MPDQFQTVTGTTGLLAVGAASGTCRQRTNSTPHPVLAFATFARRHLGILTGGKQVDIVNAARSMLPYSFQGCTISAPRYLKLGQAGCTQHQLGIGTGGNVGAVQQLLRHNSHFYQC